MIARQDGLLSALLDMRTLHKARADELRNALDYWKRWVRAYAREHHF